jgi:ubiquinone/menaquinone biosynthesis C-methylase UbiE
LIQNEANAVTEETSARERFVPALGRESLTSLYDPLLRLTTRERAFKQRLLRQANIRAGAHVLDLGCGTGTLSLWAKRRVPAARIVGIDADPKVLSRALSKAAKAGCEVEFDKGLSYELPYPNASFDRVLSSLLFHHLTDHDKERTAREIARVLKPGGELHVADWGEPSSIVMRALFLSVQLLDGFNNTRGNLRGLLLRLFEEAGLERVRKRDEMRTVYGTLALYSASKLQGATA